ncbi:MAG: hypothetical protein K0R89_2754 [Ramlibacter sp.]|nr:hypothetical protein [Ramlibacter sp.]
MSMCLQARLPMRGLLAALLLGGGGAAHAVTAPATLAVTATVVSKNVCKFATNNLAVPFGTIDPSLTTNKTVTVTTTIKCAGSSPVATFAITVNDGLWSTGANARRMRHGTIATEFMPYGLTVSPLSGNVTKNVNQTVTITGTVLPADYQNRSSGGYSDTVVLTLTP